MGFVDHAHRELAGVLQQPVILHGLLVAEVGDAQAVAVDRPGRAAPLALAIVARGDEAGRSDDHRPALGAGQGNMHGHEGGAGLARAHLAGKDGRLGLDHLGNGLLLRWGDVVEQREWKPHERRRPDAIARLQYLALAGDIEDVLLGELLPGELNIAPVPATALKMQGRT